MEDPADKNTRHKQCSVCSQLSDIEKAFRKYGNDDLSTSLPPVSEKLVIVKDFRPFDDRKIQLQQCPECGTYYMYRTYYDYYINGSEDEQELTRITDAEASSYLQQEQ